MKDFDRDAASRPVSIPAQVDAPNDSDSEATRDIPPASVEDRSAKDRGRQDVVGSITDSDPSRALSTRVEGSAYFEPPRVLATTLHLKRPRTASCCQPAQRRRSSMELPGRRQRCPKGRVCRRGVATLQMAAVKGPRMRCPSPWRKTLAPWRDRRCAKRDAFGRHRAGKGPSRIADGLPGERNPARQTRADCYRRRSVHPVVPFARDLAESARDRDSAPPSCGFWARDSLSGRSR